MSKHTPGPWAVEVYNKWINSEELPPLVCHIEDLVIVTKNEGNNTVGSEEGDARLIATAPEMLEALKEIAVLIKESQGVAGYHLNGDVADWDSLELKLFDAIAKAEGDV